MSGPKLVVIVQFDVGDNQISVTLNRDSPIVDQINKAMFAEDCYVPLAPGDEAFLSELLANNSLPLEMFRSSEELRIIEYRDQLRFAYVESEKNDGVYELRLCVNECSGQGLNSCLRLVKAKLIYYFPRCDGAVLEKINKCSGNESALHQLVERDGEEVFVTVRVFDRYNLLFNPKYTRHSLVKEANDGWEHLFRNSQLANRDYPLLGWTGIDRDTKD